MTIQEVTNNFEKRAFDLYRSCAKYHADKGFFQWDENYPTREIVANDIKNQQLFGLFEDDNLIGVIALTHDEPIEYAELSWNDQSGKYIIIHRLCIDPLEMRKGYAKKIMEFSENWCKEQGYSSIRLDTFSPNKGAVQFYSSLGYEYKGEVFFPKRKDDGYTCFEKLL